MTNKNTFICSVLLALSYMVKFLSCPWFVLVTDLCNIKNWLPTTDMYCFQIQRHLFITKNTKANIEFLKSWINRLHSLDDFCFVIFVFSFAFLPNEHLRPLFYHHLLHWNTLDDVHKRTCKINKMHTELWIYLDG